MGNLAKSEQNDGYKNMHVNKICMVKICKTKIYMLHISTLNQMTAVFHTAREINEKCNEALNKCKSYPLKQSVCYIFQRSNASTNNNVDMKKILQKLDYTS